jgi:hypothetical protein
VAVLVLAPVEVVAPELLTPPASTPPELEALVALVVASVLALLGASLEAEPLNFAIITLRASSNPFNIFRISLKGSAF